MVNIEIIDGKVKFVRVWDDCIMCFECKSISHALASKAAWEALMYN